MDIIQLTSSEITELLELFSEADLNQRRVRVAIAGGGFSIKIDEGLWSRGMGEEGEDR